MTTTRNREMEKVMFLGRTVGSIGGTYRCNALVPTGSTYSEAMLYLSDRYEHIQWITFIEREDEE